LTFQTPNIKARIEKFKEISRYDWSYQDFVNLITLYKSKINESKNYHHRKTSEKPVKRIAYNIKLV
jgi:hypothetical protein